MGKLTSAEDREALQQLSEMRKWVAGNSETIQAVRRITGPAFLKEILLAIVDFTCSVKPDYSYNDDRYTELMRKFAELDVILVSLGYLEKYEE